MNKDILQKAKKDFIGIIYGRSVDDLYKKLNFN